jgi:hypothetical protein
MMLVTQQKVEATKKKGEAEAPPGNDPGLPPGAVP